MDEADPRGRLHTIAERIDAATGRFGILHTLPRLIAVSKTFPSDAIVPLLEAGQRVFGENRVQEVKEKWPALRARFPGVELHLIGPLQTNKARDAVVLFDCIQTLDRERLAAALRIEMDKTGRDLPCYVQVNIGLEPQKNGVVPAETAAFVQLCRNQYGLDIVGLMCIPPEGQPAGAYFAQLAVLGQEAQTARLSMGMSADFETAIAMGATDVRVGSALFGTRN
jgi:PLP dependent protein